MFFLHYVIKLCNTLLKSDMKAENTNGSKKIWQTSGDKTDFY